MEKIPLITNIHQLISSQSSGNASVNLEWANYDIGVKGSNVAVFGTNGAMYNLQNVINPLLPTRFLNYGEPIWDNENEITELLTWDNIQKWLDEDKITNFLKEGDCIKIRIKQSGNTEDCFWHIWVIGINTYNGQKQPTIENDYANQELGTPHIDFCGGSYANGINSSVTEGHYTGEQKTQTFLRIGTINGLSHPNNSTSHFVQEGLLKTINTSLDSFEYNNILSKLKMNGNTTAKPHKKRIILEKRPPIVESPFFSQWCTSSGLSSNDLLTALEQIAIRIKEIKDNSPEDYNEYGLLWIYREIVRLLLGYDNNFPFPLYSLFTSAEALFLLRYSVQLEKDPVLDMITEDKTKFTSADALYALRQSVGFDQINGVPQPYGENPNHDKTLEHIWGFLCNAPDPNNSNSSSGNAPGQLYGDGYVLQFKPDEVMDEFADDSSLAESIRLLRAYKRLYCRIWTQFVRAIHSDGASIEFKTYGPGVDVNSLNKYEGTFRYTIQDGFCSLVVFLSYFVLYAIENGGLQRTYAIDAKESNPFTTVDYYFWGLTEKELFGQVIFGQKITSLGFGFTYPILQYPYYKRCIQYDLVQGRPNLAGSKSKCVTLTAVEGSTTDIVGMGSSLEPTTYNALDPESFYAGSTQYNNAIDMPICFRFQRTRTKAQELYDNS